MPAKCYESCANLSCTDVVKSYILKFVPNELSSTLNANQQNANNNNNYNNNNNLDTANNKANESNSRKQKKSNNKDSNSHKNNIASSNVKSQQYKQQLETVVDALEKLTSQLKVFCEQRHHYKQTFSKIVTSLNLENVEVAKEHFQFICDELFIEGIKWSHIITFLTLCGELAINVSENSLEHGDDAETDDSTSVAVKLNLLIDIASSYSEEKLSFWVDGEGGGWTTVPTLLIDEEALNSDISQTTRYYKYGFLAALVGIYFFVTRSAMP